MNGYAHSKMPCFSGVAPSEPKVLSDPSEPSIKLSAFNAALDRLARMVDAMERGQGIERYLPLAEAARRYGFWNYANGKPALRAFKDFLSAEGVTYKQGTNSTGKYSALVDACEVERAFARNRRAVAG